MAISSGGVRKKEQERRKVNLRAVLKGRDEESPPLIPGSEAPM
jgi:hypothetical protein